MRGVNRNCPLCDSPSRGVAFPYATEYRGERFAYVRCSGCSTVFVDPVPSTDVFRAMYAKTDYHDVHYDGVDDEAYRRSVAFMAPHVKPGVRVLDYGCGTGAFLKACSEAGFGPVGVDFDGDAARAAGERVGCPWFSSEEFEAAGRAECFDVVHLGDVLEHLPDPLATLTRLADRLVAGGALFIEGPIEANFSPVRVAAVAYGRMKRVIRPKQLAGHAPTHLFMTNASSQERFFTRLGPGYRVAGWEVSETGWPYRGGGTVKRLIAKLAVAAGGRQVFGAVSGNRFKIVLLKTATSPLPA